MVEANYFEADCEINIFVANSDYSKIREIDGCGHFQDLPEAIEDVKIALMNWYKLDTENTTNYILYNATNADFRQLRKNAEIKLQANEEKGKKTLVKSFFAGHGIMSGNDLFAVTCDSSRPTYKFEKVLMNLTASPNAFGINVFDCCRKNFTFPKAGTRGGTIASESTIDIDDVPPGKHNYISFYSCLVNNEAEQKSDYTPKFFEKLQQLADKDSKVVILPEQMQTFKGGEGKGGIGIDYNRSLKYIAREPTIREVFKLEEKASALRTKWDISKVEPMLMKTN